MFKSHKYEILGWGGHWAMMSFVRYVMLLSVPLRTLSQMFRKSHTAAAELQTSFALKTCVEIYYTKSNSHAYKRYKNENKNENILFLHLQNN